MRKLLTILVAAITCAGCGDSELPTEYGGMGLLHAGSVNGTAVLADMFRQAGHNVTSRQVLSPAIDQADAIVWFPDDFQGPTREVRERLEEWLIAAPDRTLVYVGRDFDAAVVYWETMLPRAAANQRSQYRTRKAAAERWYRRDRAALPADPDNADYWWWFRIDASAARHDVQTLTGPWSQGIDATQVDIRLEARLIPDLTAHSLLACDDGVVVSRKEFYVASAYSRTSQLILVQNGSFLLNLPLVNHEHRKLAARLIEQVEASRHAPLSVVFLESGPGGPPVLDQDPQAGLPTRFTDQPPLSHILLHLAVAGVLFVLASWPIFGLARPSEPAGTSDFGKHVDAVGEMLARARASGYSRNRLEDYRRRVSEE